MREWVRLQPPDESASFVEKVGMGVGNRLERFLPMLIGGGVLEHLEGFDQAAADRRLEEVPLRSE